MTIDTFFLPAFMLLGVISTLEDIKFRRISNILILITLIYAVAAHIYLFVSSEGQETVWFGRLWTNVLISLIVAVYFWKQHWWGGGDAKLFVCYSILIPLFHYPIAYFSYYFASFLLLVITFFPAAVSTFFHARYQLMKAGQKIDYIPPYSSPGRLLKFFQFIAGSLATLFLFNLLAMVLRHYFTGVKGLFLLIWFFGFVFYNKIFILFEQFSWLVMLAWGVVFCLIMFVPFFHQLNVLHLLFYSFCSWLILFILRVYIFRTIEKYVSWSKDNHMAFAGWMFLGGLIIWFSKTMLVLKVLFHIK